jgi:hypothetical protein
MPSLCRCELLGAAMHDGLPDPGLLEPVLDRLVARPDPDPIPRYQTVPTEGTA